VIERQRATRGPTAAAPSESPRVAFITNLAPFYRVPLFRRLAAHLDVTYFFFSTGDERYLTSAVHHDPADLPTKDVRRVSVAGHPVLVGLQRELDPDRYDVVVKCINGRLMVPYTYGLAKRRRIPFVLWTGIWSHPTTPFHRATRPLTEQVYRGSDAIVVYGEHVKRFLSSVRGVDPSKLFVSGQAAPVEPFRALEPGIDAEPPTIVFIGRLEAEKGLETLFEAMKRLDADVRLRIVGDGPLTGAVRRHAAVDPRVELVGPVTHAALPTQLSDARCLVLPSITTRNFREPWGFVVKGEQGREDVKAHNYERMSQGFIDGIEHALAVSR
jgi:glycosyltransferase involved in cell wall biosynthesis